MTRAPQDPWREWVWSQSPADKATICFSAIERLLEEGKIKFFPGGPVDKWGSPIPAGAKVDSHLYWNDEHKEDLRVPF